MQYPNHQKTIAVCHGQNCRDVGGKALTEKLINLGIPFDIIPCQSLCAHAPTAKVGKIAILHANIDKLSGSV